jgi:hypothetical protein
VPAAALPTRQTAESTCGATHSDPPLNGVPKLRRATVHQRQETYAAKYPKAPDKLLKDREVLLAHFDFPAEHWVHLRTTNAIESTFATVRLRTHKTKGAGSRSAGLAMAYKLLAAAQVRWRRVNVPHLVALVRAGATFVDGIKVEREDQKYAALSSPTNPQHLTIAPDVRSPATAGIDRT